MRADGTRGEVHPQPRVGRGRAAPAAAEFTGPEATRAGMGSNTCMHAITVGERASKGGTAGTASLAAARMGCRVCAPANLAWSEQTRQGRASASLPAP